MGKNITREQVEDVAELVNQWVAENLEPGSGVVVITAEKGKDVAAKVVASKAVDNVSSVVWDGAPGDP